MGAKRETSRNGQFHDGLKTSVHYAQGGSNALFKSVAGAESLNLWGLKMPEDVTADP